MPGDPDCEFPTRTGPAFPLQVPWTTVTLCNMGALFSWAEARVDEADEEEAGLGF